MSHFEREVFIKYFAAAKWNQYIMWLASARMPMRGVPSVCSTSLAPVIKLQPPSFQRSMAFLRYVEQGLLTLLAGKVS